MIRNIENIETMKVYKGPAAVSYNAMTPGTRYYRGHFTRISHTELLLIIRVGRWS